MKSTVFVHTNEKQIAGAIVSKHSLKRNSKRPDSFDVQIIQHKNYPFFADFEGRKFLRAGTHRTWVNDDLQSFTPLRFMPPELMNYKGRALVIDPDVFAVGDVTELLECDMQEKAILAKPRPGHNGREDYVATSVMLLDCAKLTHWNVRENFEEMFRLQRDYDDWITLATEPNGSIGKLHNKWNDFDRLASDTCLLHNTKRRTQPWKTGLPIDFTNRIPFPFVAKLLGRDDIRLPLRYKRHPDRRQEQLFFSLLKECLENGLVDEQLLANEMQNDHVRHDALDVMSNVQGVDELLAGIGQSQAA